MEISPNEILFEFRKWVNDKNLWVRRAVAASIAYYSIRQKGGLKREFQKLLTELQEEKEYYVKEPVEWAYREMNK